MKILEMAHKSKISEVAVVSCLFCMVAVWIMVAESIQDFKHTTKEKLNIVRAVDHLINLIGGRGHVILLACLKNLPESKIRAVNDVTNIDIPLDKAIELFLTEDAASIVKINRVTFLFI